MKRALIQGGSGLAMAESGRSLLWTLSPEEDCCCSWLHSCTNTNNTITNTVTIYFLNAFTTRDYDLRCQLGTADPTKKKFLLSSVILYHTYNLHIHIYIKTYIHIYNSMYRVNRDKKMTCIYQNRFSFFPAFNNFYFLIISLFKCKQILS